MKLIANPQDCVWTRLLTPRDLQETFLFPGGNLDHTMLVAGQTYFDRGYSSDPQTSFYRLGGDDARARVRRRHLSVRLGGGDTGLYVRYAIASHLRVTAGHAGGRIRPTEVIRQSPWLRLRNPAFAPKCACRY